MEYLLGVISLISLVFNYFIYRRITATYMVGTVEELCCCKVEQIESEPVEAHEPPLVTVPMVQDVYGAWKNQKEIPWVPPVKTPEPINKPPNRGPLARPDGFI